MTDTAVSSINASHIYSVIEGISDEGLEDAKRSHGWSVVIENHVRHAREAGADWRDVLAALEAWTLAKLPAPTEFGEQLACAAMHGLYDGMVTGRVVPALDGGDSSDATDLEVAILTTCGFEGFAVDYCDAGGVPVALLAISTLTTAMRHALRAEDGFIRLSGRERLPAGRDGLPVAWYEVAEAAREIACIAWESCELPTDGEALCLSLAEAVRIVTRTVKS